jgi:riboflavin kinase / FMN adenylyltransferase
MRVLYGIEALGKFKNPVITIGTFDGVHQGHKTILQKVVNETKAINGTSILITFDPHPRKLIFPNESLKLLSTLEERLGLVADAGIDVTVVIPFTKEFSSLSAQDYVGNFLVKIFHPSLIVIGYDHRFGQDRKGDIILLRQYGLKYGFEVKEISAQLISEAAVSSTQIRNALLLGNVALATKMLGMPYQISGRVVKGAQRGRLIGFPTANINLPDGDKLLPKSGAYAVKVCLANKTYGGMLNIGFNPTVSEDLVQKVEVHIFDFDQQIYDEVITVSFVAGLRDERKFENIESLKAQLNVDKKMALSALDTIN